jgi:hypothetical protein
MGEGRSKCEATDPGGEAGEVETPYWSAGWIGGADLRLRDEALLGTWSLS